MSEGPISKWWKSHTPERVTIADKNRVCMGQDGRGYCGRRSAPRTAAWSKVTCPDCRAAYRADGGKLR